MYHALLTNRYLTSRVIPFIAVAAVGLCVALVIIVVSVMTGFLNMVKNSGATLMGDVVISYPVSGIPHYDRLLERIEELPQTAAATPVVDSLCLLKMPYPDGPDKQTEMVQFWGIEPASFARVTGFADTVFWREMDDDQWRLLLADVIERQWRTILSWMDDEQKFTLVRKVADLERGGTVNELSDQQVRDAIAADDEINWPSLFRSRRFDFDFFKDRLLTEAQWEALAALDPRITDPERLHQDGLTLTRHGQPAIVLGLHVSEGNIRNEDGTYDAYGWRWWMPRYNVTLTTVPVRDGPGEPESLILPVANEFQSGVFMIDDMRVMIPIAEAQRLLQLNEAELTDPDDFTLITGIEPARATMVLVKAAEDVTAEQLRDVVEIAYQQFVQEIWADDTTDSKPPQFGVSVQTWTQQQAQFIGPVEKERELMRTLFSLVYIVCAGLVLAIFWAIVYEKTRDIGILRSVGASRIGISWIFLRYGLIVGTLGAIAGLGMGWLVVHNINPIHHAMGNPPPWMAWALAGATFASVVVTIVKALSGRLLPLVVGGLVTGVLAIMTTVAFLLIRIGGIIIWDPSVYYFTVIPNEVDFNNAYLTMGGAVLFSLIGAFLPAAKAADVDPVRALQYE